jgi:hypothetical protein
MSAWIKHVKSYANKHNCSFGDALSRASASYNRGGRLSKPKKSGKKSGKKQSRRSRKSRKSRRVRRSRKSSRGGGDTANPEQDDKRKKHNKYEHIRRGYKNSRQHRTHVLEEDRTARVEKKINDCMENNKTTREKCIEMKRENNKNRILRSAF